jgi:hypothetical protein
MVFGGNLGEWCKWVTRMEFNVWKGPIFEIKMRGKWWVKDENLDGYMRKFIVEERFRRPC